jgi:Uma2 family endonuclease
MREDVRFAGHILLVTVSRQADGWFASSCIEAQVRALVVYNDTASASRGLPKVANLVAPVENRRSELLTAIDVALHTLTNQAFEDDDALLALSDRLQARIERIDGQLVVSPGTGGLSGRRNSRLTAILDGWARTHGYVSFDSSTGFHMPNDDTPSPDHALIAVARWEALTEAQQRTLPPMVPDIVVEIRSESDSRSSAVAKCERWFSLYLVGCVTLLDPMLKKIGEWDKKPPDWPDLGEVLLL